jgi:hypothetical protein
MEMPLVDKYKANTLYSAMYFTNSARSNVISINPNGSSYLNGGNVGIGTATPNAKLEIRDPASVTANLRLSTPSNIAELRQLGATDDFDLINYSTWGAQSSGAKIRFFTNNDTTTPKMVIQKDGNVGIGTTNPGVRIDIGNYGIVGDYVNFENTMRITGQRLNANGSFASFRLSNTAQQGGTYFGIVARRETSNFGVSADFTVNNIGASITPLTALTLQYNGNVGIGTTSPGQKLEVNGNIKLTSGGTIYGDGTNSYLALSNNGGSKIAYGPVYLEALAASVNIHATSEPIAIWNNNGNIRLANDGNVGIGTTAPGTKLDVAGAIRTNNQLISTVAVGTAPLAVTSTTVNTNLNADMIDGIHSTGFQTALTNPVTGTGTANYLSKFMAGSTL